MRSSNRVPVLFLALCLSCSGGSGPADQAGEEAVKDLGPEEAAVLADAADVAVDAAPDVGPDSVPVDLQEVDSAAQCPLPGVKWSPGTAIFAEVTADWKLEEIGVQGFRLNVTDIDGDGWADLVVRWGEGPDSFIPEGERHRWVLRNSGFGSFEDVTQASGLFAVRGGDDPTATRPGEVMASADVDNDGDLDIAVATSMHHPDKQVHTSELMLNNGNGTFVLGPEDSGYRRVGLKTVPAGLAFTDYDRDGRIDLWMSQNMAAEATMPLQDALFKGNGKGHLTDATGLAGLTTLGWYTVPLLNQGLGHSWAWSAAACDLNNDGVTELLAASYGRAPNHLWQGAMAPDGTVTFANRSVDSGYAYDHRMDWSDNESAMCYCKLHPEAEDCEGIPPPKYIKCQTDADVFRWNHATDREPWRLGGNSANTSCADVDNDGWIDLMTGEIVHWDVGTSSDPAELMFNLRQPDVKFERPGNEETGLLREYPGVVWDNGDMTGAVFDFDNDGWADVYIGSSDYPHTRGLLFHQESPRKFAPVADEDFFEHKRSHGIAVADFDRDGDLDLVVGHSQMRCGGQYLDDCYPTLQVRMFENLIGQDGNWVQFRLEGGEGTNRAAIGARVTVAAGGVTQTRDVEGGHGHFGAQDDMVVHFGLGAACTADVEIRWPDMKLSTQHFTVAGGFRYRVIQGKEPVPDLP